jgi:pyruvate dehydrogenase E2 component (dihydrolipoamide acetyltransferase)
MAQEVIMPKAGMAMEEGKVIRWLKKEGEHVKQGEPLLEIETDKVAMEVEAAASGTLIHILAQEGEIVPVTRVIGYIGNPGEKIAQAAEDKPAAAEEKKEAAQAAAENNAAAAMKHEHGKIAATPLAKATARQRGIDLDKVRPSGKLGQILARDIDAVKLAAATPLARKIAEDMQVDIGSVAGSGHNGKVTRADVLAAAPKTSAPGEDELRPHSAMRRVIAKRMLQSHLEIPPVTQSCVADVTELMALRENINAQNAARISVNDFIILAVAKTLEEQPYINASFTEEGLMVKKHINIGVAVALPEGLIVPVIKDANTLSLRQISETAKALALKAKEGKLSPDEYSGGTFTISNLGMMGVTSFTPIINQPESAILGVCAVTQQLEMDDGGRIQKRMKMGLSLTYDHRSIDGAQAAIFSNRVTELLEHPLMMLA